MNFIDTILSKRYKRPNYSFSNKLTGCLVFILLFNFHWRQRQVNFFQKAALPLWRLAKIVAVITLFATDKKSSGVTEKIAALCPPLIKLPLSQCCVPKKEDSIVLVVYKVYVKERSLSEFVFQNQLMSVSLLFLVRELLCCFFVRWQ